MPEKQKGADLATDRVRGRTAPDLPTHTFRDSGITIRLHKISPMTSQLIIETVQREMPKPEPPIQEVDYGEGKVKRPNRQHSVYLEMLKEWQDAVSRESNNRLFRLICLDAVELTIGDEERTAIERKKRSLAIIGVTQEPEPNLTAEENDRLFYIEHVCCGSPDDLKEFYVAVTQRSQPTEGAVQRHAESFPGDMEG